MATDEITYISNDQSGSYPPVLGLPMNSRQYWDRFICYYRDRKLRKTTFAHRELSSYHKAKVMYYDAYRLIAFFHRYSVDDIKKLDPSYDVSIKTRFARKSVIVLRKTAESCYYTNDLAMGLKMCYLAIEVAGKSLKYMTWYVHCVVSWIYMSLGDLTQAEKSLNTAVLLHESSIVIDETRERLARLQKTRNLHSYTKEQIDVINYLLNCGGDIHSIDDDTLRIL